MYEKEGRESTVKSLRENKTQRIGKRKTKRSYTVTVRPLSKCKANGTEHRLFGAQTEHGQKYSNL